MELKSVHFTILAISILVLAELDLVAGIRRSKVKRPGDSCDGIHCRRGFMCKDGHCVKDHRPIDSCATVFCSEDFVCIGGECIRQPTCDEIVCGVEEECRLEEIQCSEPPCMRVPTCHSTVPCEMIECRSGTICHDSRCVPEPSCENVMCGPRQECYLEDQPCFSNPCPLPVPTCGPISKCSGVRCRKGYVCIDGYCVTVPNCDGMECPSGQECYLKEVFCVRGPCPPLPTCRPVLTCELVGCMPGYICVDNTCIPEHSEQLPELLDIITVLVTVL